MPDDNNFIRAYLGSALLDPHILAEFPIETADIPSDYYRKLHIAMKNTLDRHGKLDILLLSEEFGDTAELAALLGETPSALHADAYAREIRREAEKRDILGIASMMANDAAKGEVDAGKYIERITDAIRAEGTAGSLTEAVEKYRDWMAFRKENKSDVWGIPTPWPKFNRITGGLHKKESTLIYGKSGNGKTVMIIQMAYHAASLGFKVDIYELEMPAEKIVERMVAMYSNVAPDLVNKGQANDYETKKIEDALRYIESLPIRISDATHWTSATIRADQQKKGKDKADVVIVDYLALLQDKAESSHERVEDAAKALRRMVKDFDQVLLTVGSQVKDGSIKGTEEVLHAQDQTWFLERISTDINDPARDLVPSKGRYMGEFAKIPLTFKKGVPVMEERVV